MLAALVGYDPLRFDEAWHRVSLADIARQHRYKMAATENAGFTLTPPAPAHAGRR